MKVRWDSDGFWGALAKDVVWCQVTLACDLKLLQKELRPGCFRGWPILVHL